MKRSGHKNVALYSLSICTGGTAGLELGLRIAVGSVQPLTYVEREKTACETLVARFEDGSLDPAPIWSDLATFDATPFRGLVDICSAGLPCQPYSVAGKREGHKDERAIWPDFIRVVVECLPRLVFLENVPEFLKHFRPVGEELSRLGYTVEEPLLIAASNVGAAHKRLRVFILAYHERARCDGPALGSGDDGRQSLLPARSELSGGIVADNAQLIGRRESFGLRGSTVPSSVSAAGSELAFPALGGCGDVADSRLGQLSVARRGPVERDGAGSAGEILGNAEQPREDARSEASRSRDAIGESSSDVAQPAIEGLQERKDAGGLRELAPVERTSSAMGIEQRGAGPQRIFSLDIAPGPFAFSPDNPGWSEILEHAPWLNPAIEPGLRLLVDGTSLVVDESRTDQLRSLGNGVVPLQAACAFRLLVRRAGL